MVRGKEMTKWKFYKENEEICFENKYVRLKIDSGNALVKSIQDKTSGKEMKGEDVCFFSLIGKGEVGEIMPECISLKEESLIVQTGVGSFEIKILAEEEYFTFELVTPLPGDSYKAVIAHARYRYDPEVKSNCGAIGIALTYWADPCFYPDAKALETKAEITTRLKDAGAKYVLIIAPINYHKEILKKAALTIEKGQGIFTRHGGAWGTDSRLNFGNTIIPDHCSMEYIEEKMELFKTLGIQHIDFHKGTDSFCQGDFKYVHFENGADFKAKIVDTLEKNGMYAGLHTYSFYIDYGCDSILSDSKWQKQLSVLGTYTLAEDIDENAFFLPTVEATCEISDNFGFMSRNTMYLLVGGEIMEFEDSTDGFRIRGRGQKTTERRAYKKGEKIYHLDGYYHGVAPVPGSELFYQVARNTARAFNEGGYRCIYLDALEGIMKHCAADEAWFYIAAFVCEMLAHCDREPMVEASSTYPFLWPLRGRFGAYDTPAKGYKHWNRKHVMNNAIFADRFATTTLGWYDFYPIYPKVPANINTKYHHVDDSHYLGSLALMYDMSMVYNEFDSEVTENYPAFYRNVEIFRIYDTLRKEKYFPEQVLEKVRAGEYEYHLKEISPGEFVFCEKEYQVKKLYSLTDGERNKGVYQNPFLAQTPFIRIEALLSADDQESLLLAESDLYADFPEHSVEYCFEQELDISGCLAKKVTIRGNGRKGTLAFIMEAVTGKERGVLKYYVDTDFIGCREFILLESDNGMRPDLLFDGDVYGSKTTKLTYSDYRAEFDHSRVRKLTVDYSGDIKGVGLSAVTAVRHISTTIKNPTVKIGESKVSFLCDLKSTEYIEFDGVDARIVDCYGNQRDIMFQGSVEAPEGRFEAELTADNGGNEVLRAQLTMGFSGQIIPRE